MKRKLFLFTLAAVLFGYACSAYAQTRVIKVNVLSPIARTATVFYEQKVKEKTSLQLGVFYTFAKFKTTEFRGFGITPEYRFYRSEDKEAPYGFYFAPYLHYVRLTLTAPHYDYVYSTSGSLITENKSNVSSRLTAIGGGLMIGRQSALKSRFLINMFIGLGYNSPTLKIGKNGKEENYAPLAFMSPVNVRAGVALGLAF